MALDLAAPCEAEAPDDAPPAADEAAGGRHRRRERRSAALVLVAFTVLAVALFRDGWASPATRNIGGPNDPLFNMWMLRWTPWALANGQNPLFTDHLNFPYGVNLMWNALIPLHSLLLWPLTAVAGPLVSYNALVTLNVGLSAWCAYLALRSFVSSRRAAVVGGLVYGFSPFMLAQSLDHPTLTAAYMPPLLVLVLRQILVTQTRSATRMGALLGLMAAVQLFVAEEMLAAQALAGAVGLLVLVALNPRSVVARGRHAITALATGAAVFLLLTFWALRFQFFGPQRITGGTAQRPNVFVTDLANFVVPTKVQQVAPGWAAEMSRRWTGNLSEWDAYIGVPLLMLVAFTVLRHWRRPVVRFAALLGLAMAVLSLGPNLHVNGNDTGFPLAWRAIEPLPLLGHILPARLMVFVFLMIALLVAILIDHLRPSRSRLGRSALAVAGLTVVASLLPDLSYPSTPVSVPRFFTDGTVRMIPVGSVALVAPFQQLYPADPMLWQAEADMRFRMPQGYFFVPDERGEPRYGAPFSFLSVKMYDIQAGQPAPRLTPEERSTVAQDLAVREVQTVIVGPMQHQQEMVGFFRSILGQPPERFDDVYVWQRAQRLLR